MTNKNNLLTVQEASEILNLGVRWVQILCKRGVIKAFKIGRDWAIP